MSLPTALCTCCLLLRSPIRSVCLCNRKAMVLGQLTCRDKHKGTNSPDWSLQSGDWLMNGFLTEDSWGLRDPKGTLPWWSEKYETIIVTLVFCYCTALTNELRYLRHSFKGIVQIFEHKKNYESTVSILATVYGSRRAPSLEKLEVAPTRPLSNFLLWMGSAEKNLFVNFFQIFPCTCLHFLNSWKNLLMKFIWYDEKKLRRGVFHDQGETLNLSFVSLIYNNMKKKNIYKVIKGHFSTWNQIF